MARATAQAFGKRGAKIGLLARGQAGLDGAKADVEQAGGEALAIPTDVSDYDQVEAAAAAVEEAFGPIDIWVNVAFTCTGVPQHPPAVCLLRRQARDQRLHVLRAHRAAAREEQGAHHRGANARREHPAVLLGALQAAEPSATGAADLPARSCRPRRSLRRRPPRTQAVLGRGLHRRLDRRQQIRRAPA
ncbi:SDR family oxidoreductase [Arthrobacter sp.]|uniref:SDR family NAD(P)-dependent oxidoreductase n=1 Tax=Arthrobacter sp. TaxID=1667 RepID=UPI00338EEF54